MANGAGKSSVILNVMKWTERAAEMIKEALDSNEQLHVPPEKAPLLLQTLTSILLACRGELPSNVVRDLVALTEDAKK